MYMNSYLKIVIDKILDNWIKNMKLKDRSNYSIHLAFFFLLHYFQDNSSIKIYKKIYKKWYENI